MAKTRRLTAILIVTIVPAILASPAAAQRTKKFTLAKTEEDFEKIVAGLTEAAEAYAESDTDKAPELAEAIRSVYYDPKASEHIGEALMPDHKDPVVRLYLAYHVMQPLDKASDKQLLKLKSPLLKLFSLCKYKRMPIWPQYKLQRLTIPKRRMSQAERRRREDAKREFLAEKQAKERAVTKHNRLVDAMQRTLKLLLIRMGDEQADKIMVTRLGEEEDSRWTTFQTTLAGIQNDAIDMNQAQAKRYYNGMLQLFRRSKQQREYYDPTKPKYSSTANSQFHKQKNWFARETAKVINIVSTIAREPAILVPGDKKPGKRKRR